MISKITVLSVDSLTKIRFPDMMADKGRRINRPAQNVRWKWRGRSAWVSESESASAQLQRYREAELTKLIIRGRGYWKMIAPDWRLCNAAALAHSVFLPISRDSVISFRDFFIGQFIIGRSRRERARVTVCVYASDKIDKNFNEITNYFQI